MSATMPVKVPGWPCAVPCQKPRPGQACSTAIARKNAPRAVSSRRPRAAERQDSLRQRDEHAGQAVEERRARRPEQHRQAGRQHPAERLAEDPDHQTPGHAGRPGQPRPGAAGRGQHPDPDSDLDPDRRGTGLDRVVGPGGSGPVHQGAHPAGRRRGRRCDDLARQSGRHRWLRLEDAVEDPQQPEGQPQQPARRGLGCRPGWPGPATALAWPVPGRCRCGRPGPGRRSRPDLAAIP